MACITSDDVHLVVHPRAVSPLVAAYVDSLDLEQLAFCEAPEIRRYEDDPSANFYLSWIHAAGVPAVSPAPALNMLPQGDGLMALWQDMTARAALVSTAIGATRLECELRFALERVDDILHTDGLPYTAGTAYKGPRTAFIDAGHLAGKDKYNAQRRVGLACWQPHLRYPGLNDLYLFDMEQEHGVPFTGEPRITLFMRGGSSTVRLLGGGQHTYGPAAG